MIWRARIEAAWEAREQLGVASKGEVREAVEAALDGSGQWLAARRRKDGGEWMVHQWLKKAVLLSFRLNDMKIISGAPGEAVWWDKVDSKFLGWDEAQFRAAGFRAVPGAMVRRSAFIAKGAVLMPSFVNVGARVGEGTMIDTWATVGSCAQVGAHCHISGGAGLGRRAGAAAGRAHHHRGQLLHRRPRRSGRRRDRGRRQRAVAWASISPARPRSWTAPAEKSIWASVPPYSVVVSGSLPSGNGPRLYCAVIVKRVDEKTRAKTSINELLRD